MPKATVQVNLRMDIPLYELIATAAHIDGMSVGAWSLRALEAQARVRLADYESEKTRHGIREIHDHGRIG